MSRTALAQTTDETRIEWIVATYSDPKGAAQALEDVIGLIAGPTLAVPVAVMGWRGSGFSADRLKQLGGGAQPGSSAIVAVVEHSSVAAIERQLAAEGAIFLTERFHGASANQAEAIERGTCSWLEAVLGLDATELLDAIDAMPVSSTPTTNDADVLVRSVSFVGTTVSAGGEDDIANVWTLLFVRTSASETRLVFKDFGPPEGQWLDRLTVLIKLGERLASTFRSAEDVRDWMHERNRYLAGRSPVDEIRAGHPERVDNALEVIDSGVFV